MGDFAIVAEGFTDQVVLRHVLLGFFEHLDEEPLINFEQPPDVTTERGEHAPGGWSLVIQYFEQKKFLQALQLNRYLVVHIDTDVCEEYGVARNNKRGPLSASALVDAVVAKLQALIGDELLAAHGHRFLFAIGHDSIECWLLPLVFDGSQKAKRTKTTGCLEAINHTRRKNGDEPLSVGDSKNPDVFRSISCAFTRRKLLDACAGKNPGFAAFHRQLSQITPTP